MAKKEKFKEVSDVVIDAAGELKNYMSDAMKKISSKKINVKYFYSPLPTDKKHPDYKKVMEKVPKYAHDGDIGMDVTATSVEYDAENDAYVYHTGIYVESGRNVACLCMPRSSVYKTDSYLCNGVGLVDSFTYRGEILFIYKNRRTMQSIVYDAMLHAWNNMPWYKKLFTNFTKWCDENHESYVAIATYTEASELNFAPYEKGDRIGQLVWIEVPEANMKLVKDVEKLSKTERGKGGFGSTGK